MNQWCTIQSDPGVFTEIIKSFGIHQIQVQELYSLHDQNIIQRISPIYGFIFLFKWPKHHQVIHFHQKRDCLSNYDKDLFFARQIVHNACATQAILSILMNISNLKLGNTLTNFKQFTKQLNSQYRGLSLGNSEQIRSIHNSFAQQQVFIMKDKKKKASQDDQVYHFVSYIPFKKQVYQLDGLQQGPILLGNFQQGNQWISIAKNQINKRIQQYSQKQIRFNLLAVCSNVQLKMTKQIYNANLQKLAIYKALEQKQQLQQELKSDFQKLVHLLQQKEQFKDLEVKNVQADLMRIPQLNQHIEICESEIVYEKEKSQKYKIQNARRKHNYIPFIVNLLKGLSAKGKLEELISSAKSKKMA